MPTSTSREGRPSFLNKWAYDALLWVMTVLVDLFFREVHPRSSWKIPRKDPVIFVAAPHANQFVDPLMLMRVVRSEAKRRIAFLVAEKSTRRKFIGWASRLTGAIPVSRAMDMTKPAKGKIYLPDPDNDSTLVRGVGTDFEAKGFQVGGLIVLPSVNNVAASSEIQEIISPEELRVKKPFKGSVALEQLTAKASTDAEEGKADGKFEGTPFKAAPKVDQTEVYDSVFTHLNQGGCVGIFPEGGSHDRTELLPLKAGVAIMALGALAANPNCGVKVVPVGMNYFHAHKFRSRAVVEFGSPVEIPDELVQKYKAGERREAIGRVLDDVYQALVAVTVTTPDYDTLMLIQAVRRLYNPKHKKLPLPMVVELNRRLVKGYAKYKDDPRIVNLKKSVLAYNKQLIQLNVRDHQVEYAKLSVVKIFFTLLWRVGKLLVLSAGVLPGLVLFAPVFVAGKVISIRKSKEALAASTVKIQARDVVATWKLLVSMAFAPMLYTFYTVLLTWWTSVNRVQGYVPDFVPLWTIVIFGYIFFPAITFAALRFGEIGMDIFKSLRPLIVSLNPASGNTLVKLRRRREALAAEVTEVINTLGPELFDDFDKMRIVHDPFQDSKIIEPPSPKTPGSRRDSDTFSMDSDSLSPIQDRRTDASIGGGPSTSGHLPRNDSLKNLANIGLFSTPTRARSRSSSGSGFQGLQGGLKLQGLTPLDSSEGMDEVSQKIKGAMRERRQRRRSGHEESETDSAPRTPGSEGGGKKEV
ncbi:MAG: hypothetical protein M1822_002867 [Bathelium mastoideum]|nr:MAG: hypothetical protein M1822_002867 [Bathelium mastoideum]